MDSRAAYLSDEDIVRRFQETGDKECFAELFVRHRKRVFVACRSFFSDGAAAEDATQETFLRVYRSLHNYKGGDFLAWLTRIARNVCVDEWRRRREKETTDFDIYEFPAPLSIDSSQETHLIAEKVWREMRCLAPAQQRCLELKIEGYSYEETATRTGFTIDAVKSHLQNGRRMLWKKMEGTLTHSR
jgi:RNA polymerase sigma-70 factor (ECF subfamily)